VSDPARRGRSPHAPLPRPSTRGRLAALWRRVVPSRQTGKRGEALAARHLRRQGHTILARNLRTRFGEIDLLTRAPDGRTIVIIEVKTAARLPEQDSSFLPELRVNRDKQRRLVALATQIVRRHGLGRRPLRFDVVAVTLDAPAAQRVRHIENAFQSHV